MSKNPKIPINRLNKWYSDDEFDLDVQMGREAIEEDNNFTVVLFRVDRDTTQYDDLYGEANEGGVRYKTPVELKVMPEIEASRNESLNPNGTLRNLEDGNLKFYIHQQQLDELQVEIKYGDYVGYAVSETNIRYFSVSNDGVKNYDPDHTIMGYKSAYRTIICTPANKDEFDGR